MITPAMMKISFARLVSTEMTSLYSKSPTAFDKRLALDDKTYAEIVRKTLEEYATEGNVVIIGRGGQVDHGIIGHQMHGIGRAGGVAVIHKQIGHENPDRNQLRLLHR